MMGEHGRRSGRYRLRWPDLGDFLATVQLAFDEQGRLYLDPQGWTSRADFLRAIALWNERHPESPLSTQGAILG